MRTDVAGAALACLLLAGCTTATAGLPAAAGMRAVGDMRTLDPCSVLSPEQAAALGVERPERSDPHVWKADSCVWTRPDPHYPSYLYVEGTDQFGIDVLKTTEPRFTVVGFDAISGPPNPLEAADLCQIAIGVGSTQTLEVAYRAPQKPPPPRALICDFTRRAAQMAVLTLLTQG